MNQFIDLVIPRGSSQLVKDIQVLGSYTYRHFSPELSDWFYQKF